MSVINETIEEAILLSTKAVFAIIANSGGTAAIIGPLKTNPSKAVIKGSLPGYKEI